ncbi:MAG TPA: hypothetical protein VI756_26120 [Blastocatellia bacterium]
MEAIKSSCPRCGNAIEIPSDLDSVICSSCGALFTIRRMEGSIGLTAASAVPDRIEAGSGAFTEEGEIGRFMAITDRLALVEEDIESVASDIELVRSKEQGAPLQLGCALFGIFSLIVLVMGFFATVGKSFFGGWLFFLAIGVVVFASLKGLSKKLMSPAERRALSIRKDRLESILGDLKTEQQRLKSELQGLSALSRSTPASENGA